MSVPTKYLSCPIKKEPGANGRRQQRFGATGEIGIGGRVRYLPAGIAV